MWIKINRKLDHWDHWSTLILLSLEVDHSGSQWIPYSDLLQLLDLPGNPSEASLPGTDARGACVPQGGSTSGALFLGVSKKIELFVQMVLYIVIYSMILSHKRHCIISILSARWYSLNMFLDSHHIWYDYIHLPHHLPHTFTPYYDSHALTCCICQAKVDWPDHDIANEIDGKRRGSGDENCGEFTKQNGEIPGK